MENSVSFYFQMDKNEEFILESKEDFKEMGKRAYESAEEYFAIFKRCIDMSLNENHNALCTNISFSCELYLKSLLFYEGIDCRKIHDLFNLYELLTVKMQNEIKERHPCSNCNKDKFNLELKELGKAFIVFRYAYEKKRLAWNMSFLVELLITLHNYASEIFNINVKKEELNV